MKTERTKFACAALAVALTPIFLCVPARAQQSMPAASPDAKAGGSELNTEESMTIEHDRVQSSHRHFYDSPAERAKDDLLITEVKSELADRGISDGYPVAVDCDHGTIFLSGVVASSKDASQASRIASNTAGVVGVKNQLTWR